MDTCEELAQGHLFNLGFSDVIFEPDGSCPPDFLVDGRIAVEVRRLNRNEQMESGLRGVEVDHIATVKRFCKLLAELGPPRAGVSWFVGYKHQTPIPQWDRIKKKLRRRLVDFRDNEDEQRLRSIPIADGFEIEILHKASKPHATFFVFGGSNDSGAGEFVVPEIERNVRLCITEKTGTCAECRHKYPEWWLILVDWISFGGAVSDQDLGCLDIDHDFDKVILLNPLDTKIAFEIPKRRVHPSRI
jgi:hypothetical protein